MYEGPDLRRLNRILAVGGGLFLLGALVYFVFSILGSIVVIDETGEVVEAVATNDHQPEQHLYRLPGGIFYGIPQLEGMLEIRCRNGARKRASYVSGFMHLRIRVVGDVPCGETVEVR